MDFDRERLPSLLNPEQLEAVLHGEDPLLVLAGAGSGKTRVITYRIANLVRTHDVAPWRILAVTFTNKAAGEMRERLERLLGPGGADVWVSTFHATGARILRRDGEAIGLPRGFVVYDDGDQFTLMRRVLKDAGFGPKEVDPRRVLHFIDHAKNHGLSPDDMAKRGGGDARVMADLFRRYQRALHDAGAVDFGDLLVRLFELFEKAPEVLEMYRHRFRHILVDEFQDTNEVQMRLLRMLAPQGRGLCAVGDDDQSIYRWRGADVGNLLAFPETFPQAKVVKLEQNYRSTQTILDAAHAVIEKMPGRMAKKLWTEQQGGQHLELVAAHTERDEAQRVAERVRASLRGGVDPGEIAIFYRTNAQSRVVEEAFRLGAIPYVVVRGRSFYERAEVKDLAAYLRLAVNPLSTVDALRVINKPTRGIGATTVGRLEEASQSWEVSLVETCHQAAQVPGLAAAAQQRARAFSELVGRIALVAAEGSAGEAAEAALVLSGLEGSFLDDGSDEAMDRLANVREFVGAAKQWDESWQPDETQEGVTPLAAFLEQISLLGDADESTGPKVALMTLHASKGLEFEEVFLTGMEEGVFPHSRSIGYDGDPESLDEERRLCYVGFTRAKRRLVLSCAHSRVLFGELHHNAPSRFLGDVPRELFGLERVPEPGIETTIELDEDDGFEDSYTVDYAWDQRPQEAPAQASRNDKRREREGLVRVAVGMPARHASFGVGMIEAVDGDKVSIRFPGVGLKRVMTRFLEGI
jgi:DNA helicase-2/ATP-dependent DNA helicase PcrA